MTPSTTFVGLPATAIARKMSAFAVCLAISASGQFAAAQDVYRSVVEQVGWKQPCCNTCGHAGRGRHVCAPAPHRSSCGCNQCLTAPGQPGVADGLEPQPMAPDAAAPGAAARGAAAPGAAAAAPGLDDFGMLDSSLGATAGAYGAAPTMIGDFFAGGAQMRSVTAGQDVATVVPVAGGDRRIKIAENNSPFPLDRVFFNYNYFNNAVTDATGQSLGLNRYTFGIEKTFIDGIWSIETRVPFAGGLDSTQIVRTGADNQDTEFGNINLAVKRLLYRGDVTSVAGGLGIILPTADDARLFTSSRQLNLIVENETVHLQPFLGMQFLPNDRFWAAFFTQVDFTSGGNAVDFRGGSNGPGVDGFFQEQNLLYVDSSFGYWLYRDPCGCGTIRGIAPMIELHYSTTIQDSDVVEDESTGDIITNTLNRMDVLNLTAGLRTQLGDLSYLTVAGVAPLRGEEENLFDSEVAVQYMRLY